MRADPFVQGVEAQATRLSVAGRSAEAEATWDTFATECPTKARFYAEQGHPALKAALARKGKERPAQDGTSRGERTGAQATSASEQVSKITTENQQTRTEQSTEQNEIASLEQLSKREWASLSSREKNQLKVLTAKHKDAIEEASVLYQKVNDVDNTEPLSDDDMIKLEKYEKLLKAREASKHTVKKDTANDNAQRGSETTPSASTEQPTNKVGGGAQQKEAAKAGAAETGGATETVNKIQALREKLDRLRTELKELEDKKGNTSEANKPKDGGETELPANESSKPGEEASETSVATEGVSETASGVSGEGGARQASSGLDTNESGSAPVVTEGSDGETVASGEESLDTQIKAKKEEIAKTEAELKALIGKTVEDTVRKNEVASALGLALLMSLAKEFASEVKQAK